MKIKKTKSLTILLLTSFVLVGCSPHQDKSEVNIDNHNNEQEIEINTTELYQNTKLENTDQIINNYLSDLETKLYSENSTFDSMKEKTTQAFITLVDFIFYEQEIKGITFDELTEETKKNVFDSFLLIDAIIDKKYPDYKNHLSEKYADLKYKVSNYTLEKLGPENLEKINEAKEEISNSVDLLTDVAENITDSGKTKIKNWYEQFRKNIKTP